MVGGTVGFYWGPTHCWISVLEECVSVRPINSRRVESKCSVCVCVFPAGSVQAPRRRAPLSISEQLRVDVCRGRASLPVCPQAAADQGQGPQGPALDIQAPDWLRDPSGHRERVCHGKA